MRSNKFLQSFERTCAWKSQPYSELPRGLHICAQELPNANQRIPRVIRLPGQEIDDMTTVLGVIGGIGCGKSAVSSAFGVLGALVIDADAAAHVVIAQKDIKDALEAAFGPSILDDAQNIDRKALARLVFGLENKEALERLNNIVHPAVRVQLDHRLKGAREKGHPLVVLDIPLLMESRFRDECDHILFIEVSKETRLKRVQNRSWSVEELDRRESSQLSLAKKKSGADLVMRNETSHQELERQVKQLYDDLVVS